MPTGGVRAALRAEGAALFLAALIGFHAMGNVSWWMFAILFLAPDLSFLGYLLGPKVGAVVYNICHYLSFHHPAAAARHRGLCAR